jgi:hypothetical protein
MDVALVKDAENDVDSDDCCRDQIRLRLERSLKGLCRPLKASDQGRRRAELTFDGLNGSDGIAERVPDERLKDSVTDGNNAW